MIKSKKMERRIRYVVQKMIEQEAYEWPPKCTTILYQPLRPKCAYSAKKKTRR